MWYGYLFYCVSFFSLLFFYFTWLKLSNVYSLWHNQIFKNSAEVFLSLLLYVTFLYLNVIYVIEETWTYLTLSISTTGTGAFSRPVTNILSIGDHYLSNVDIYVFPFIYIFLLITVLSLLFCLTYNQNEIVAFVLYTAIILLAGFMLFFTDSLILFFIFYEMLLVPSFFILYKFAKTRRCVEAAYLMFFWTQFGALFLIFSFLYLFLLLNSLSFNIINLFAFSSFEINFLFVCWLIGFGVKLPIWPFYNWLPKAHVEASTNFSIFLSGVLVKFAFFGLIKCLLVVQTDFTFYWVYPFLTIGIVDAVFKLFYQIDLKKLVAYSTVVEMHWLTICVLNGYSALYLSGFCMLISHALLSTNSFLLVDAINRRFKTRLITEISGLNFLCPKLFLVILINCLVFLGFPGSIFFVAEFLFFSFFFDLFPLLCLFLIVILYLLGPTFFFRSWMNVMFGTSTNVLHTVPVDLALKEIVIYGGNLVLMFWLGISWQSFIF